MLDTVFGWSLTLPVTRPRFPRTPELARSLRRARYRGARRIVDELGRRGVAPAPSESADYRSPVRHGPITPERRVRRRDAWNAGNVGSRWSWWQMDIVGGFLLPTNPRVRKAGVASTSVAATGHT
jgi:hypothetical protein